ncbi:ABC transporter ATP-binding protein [Spirulina major]|uniref:ABC transporter ATP-binding protein n=1 Tax=Spirulina major TaxID=270636 RepID=UPI000933BD31|nr:ABC transporter ATP-binding protein/permease [Spirulina major]
MSRKLQKLFYIIDRKKYEIPVLVVIFLFVSVLDTFGIGLVGPFMGLVNRPELITDSAIIANLYQTLGFTTPSQFIISIGGLIIALFFIKVCFNFKMQEYIFKFSFSQTGSVMRRLLEAYLKTDYTFHLSRNTSVLIQTLILESQNFSQKILVPMLVSLSNLMVLGLLLCLLAWTSPIGTLSIVAVVLITYGITNLFKDRMRALAEDAAAAQSDMIRIVNHGLGSIKETHIIGCAPYFEEQITYEAKRYAMSMGTVMVFNNLPRFIIEALLVSFLIGFTLLVLIISGNTDSLTATLSVFAIASIRMLPASAAIVQATSSIRFNSYIIDKLYQDLIEAEDNRGTYALSSNHESTPSLPFQNTIDLSHISYTYPNIENRALNDISLQIQKGQSIGFIGQSGAGKTTLVDVILGLLIPKSGDLKVDGQSVYENLRGWQNLIGYIPQSIFLLDDTIEHNIAFGVPEEKINQERLRAAIAAAQLTDLIEQLPNGLQEKVGERGVRLSGGQRQRIGIARALYHQRDILVLDEATSALDNETEQLVSDSIQNLAGSLTMISIAHRLTTLKHCDRIYVLEQGKIIESGTYDEVVLKQPPPETPVSEIE